MDSLALPSPVPSIGPGDGAGLAISLDLLERAEKYLTASLAPATRRAYMADWRDWQLWCSAHGARALPASPEVLVLYLADLAPTRRLATLQRRLAALAAVHDGASLESPTSHPLVARALEGIARTHGSAPGRQARPVLVEDLRAMLAQLEDSPAGLRDRAMLLVGWALAARESELVALDLGDLVLVERGLEIRLRRGKTDQQAHGRTVPVGFGSRAITCPVRAWRAWLDWYGPRTDAVPWFEWQPRYAPPGAPAFPRLRKGARLAGRLSPRYVEALVRDLAEDAGLPAGHWTGHSLRAGFCTAASAAGVPLHVIRSVTGHAHSASLDAYVRSAHLWDEVPTGRLL